MQKRVSERIKQEKKTKGKKVNSSERWSPSRRAHDLVSRSIGRQVGLANINEIIQSVGLWDREGTYEPRREGKTAARR